MSDCADCLETLRRKLEVGKKNAPADILFALEITDFRITKFITAKGILTQEQLRVPLFRACQNKGIFMTFIAADESWFHGAISLERVGEGIQPWRLPYKQKRLFPSPNEALVRFASRAAGVRLRLRTEADSLVLQLLAEAAPEGDAEVSRRFDLVVDNELLDSVLLEEGSTEVNFSGLPAGKVFELWLPQFVWVQIKGITLPDGATLTAAPDDRKRWLTYGSSITHCRAAHSPARTWPATVARRHNLNLTCFGYGGQCHLEPMLARVIRDLPLGVISLKLGINVQGASSLSPRTFRSAVIGFIQIIREKHPTTPIGLISPIISPPRETTDNAVGLSLTKMRDELHDAVSRLQEYGDLNLHYFDGLKMFGEADTSYLPDELHPNGDGYELLGQRIAEKVLPALLGS